LSSGQGSVALIEGAESLFDVTFPNDRKHSGAFFENVELCLQRFGRPERIVVGLGPGSYAGVRIALATAVGLRSAASVTLLGLPSICALEVNSSDYCVIGDARRDSFFFAKVSGNQLSEGPILESFSQLETRISSLTLPIYTTESLPQFPRATLSYPAARRLAANADLASDAIVDAQSLEPIYLRAPHITVPRADRALASNK
jgi:tRNA threonylcarbamoyladenosine biosynthesis protein TsaB